MLFPSHFSRVRQTHPISLGRRCSPDPNPPHHQTHNSALEIGVYKTWGKDLITIKKMGSQKASHFYFERGLNPPPLGYYSAGRSPALPASTSPSTLHLTINLLKYPVDARIAKRHPCLCEKTPVANERNGGFEVKASIAASLLVFWASFNCEIYARL